LRNDSHPRALKASDGNATEFWQPVSEPTQAWGQRGRGISRDTPGEGQKEALERIGGRGKEKEGKEEGVTS